MFRKIAQMQFWQNSFFIAAILLGLFLSTTAYKYGWDDQHLEIPLLKSLIDPTLYVGDYYVESLKKHFTSLFFPALAKFIKIDQVPTAYFVLYLLSRFLLFYFVYKIWLVISQRKLDAFLCSLAFILTSRIEEFLYRTFSHQEFSLIFVFAAFYFFFKDRFIIASILLGVGTNIDALYTVFPMSYIGFFLLWQVRKHGWSTLFKSCGAFLLFSLPFILWSLKTRFASENMAFLQDPNWIDMYITTCPSNFFFDDLQLMPFDMILNNHEVFFYLFRYYIFIILIFFINLLFNEKFRENKKVQAICITAFIFLVICFVFTYIVHNRFILDLNLPRQLQFLAFFLMGYLTLLTIKFVKEEPLLLSAVFVMIYAVLRLNNVAGCLAAILMFGILLVRLVKEERTLKEVLIKVTAGMIIIGSIAAIINFMMSGGLGLHSLIRFVFVVILALMIYLLSLYFRDQRFSLILKRALLVVPFVVFFVHFVSYRIERVYYENNSDDYWRLEKGWVDLQYFVRDNTPVDAMILVPHDFEMGGFRIHSERKIIADFGDCGIVGFDYRAAQEWQIRTSLIEPFRVVPGPDLGRALRNAVERYHASYVVFLRFASAYVDRDLLTPVYRNKDFVLFKVKYY